VGNIKIYGGDMKPLNIMVVGVGGQGIITFGKILSDLCNRNGINVLVAETHGMSQRGGSVVIHIRIGEVYSPLIPIGGVDVMVALELIEAYRNIGYLSKSSTLLVNTYMIRPPLPNVSMPDKDLIINILYEKGIDVFPLDAYKMAVEAGSILSLNIVMLGALVALGILPKTLNKDLFMDYIRGMVMGDVNLRAFMSGYEYVRKMVS
jgi:indolepyruvate ferredoxin oxidoreductase beta subunit